MLQISLFSLFMYALDNTEYNHCDVVMGWNLPIMSEYNPNYRNTNI